MLYSISMLFFGAKQIPCNIMDIHSVYAVSMELLFG